MTRYTPGSFEDLYLSGKNLYGDNFDQDEIDDWFESEREGYANLGSAAEDGPGDGSGYSYHALNKWHGFRHLPKHHRFPRALGLGSAYGEEFAPIADRIGALSILEPSDQLIGANIGGLVPEYVKPNPSGTMPFADSTFDLIVCLGTLHHIPNVTHVIAEMSRVLAPGGFTLIREPIVSMGDWRQYRGTGCTERERGIPLRHMTTAIANSGLKVEHQGFSGFPVTLRLGRAFNTPTYNSMSMTVLDSAASRLTRPFYTYHASTKWQKLRPTSAFFVARKP